MKRSRFIVAGVIPTACAALLLPAAAHGVSLPFSTTFNCPVVPWDMYLQGKSASPCNFFTQYNTGHDSLGNDSMITYAANNPAGGFAGFRQWIDDGSNLGSGGMVISLPSGTTEFWVQWYMRYQQGFAWSGGSGPTYQKLIYSDVSTVLDMVNDGFVLYQQNGNYTYPAYGGPNCVAGCGWNHINGGSTGDGKFHEYELHIKVGAGTGIIEVWSDGVRILNVQNAQTGSTPWSYFVVNTNQATPANATGPIGVPYAYVDVDNISISSAGYIPPLSGGAPAQAPPAAPKGLTLR